MARCFNCNSGQTPADGGFFCTDACAATWSHTHLYIEGFRICGSCKEIHHKDTPCAPRCAICLNHHHHWQGCPPIPGAGPAERSHAGMLDGN